MTLFIYFLFFCTSTHKERQKGERFRG